MSCSWTRLWVLMVLALSSHAWAIGLGEINLDSALNEPLRAEIELLSASPDEIAELKVSLASADTFERYGIDRPFYLQGIEFDVIDAGPDSSVIRVRSRSPMAEPFLTFLVEATWPSGRLLREYTVLLDPPTYTPPASQTATAIEAPRRATPADSGQIDRAPEPQQPRPQPTIVSEPVSAATTTEPAQDAGTEPEADYEPDPDYGSMDYSSAGGDMVVAKGDTLWGIAARNSPDSSLTINQTMLAIYEANRDAFGGNINLLKAGASLRIPSADEIFQINRLDALDEVQRQHSAWGSDTYTAPAEETRPSLTLVPPDEEPVGTDYAVDDSSAYEPLSREDEVLNRINELETANVPDQQSLIEIRDNELAALRQELANIRGEVYEPPVDETIADETTDPQNVFVDEMDVSEADAAADPADETSTQPPAEVADSAGDSDPAETVSTDIISTPSSDDDGIVATVIDFVTSIWGIIGGAVILAVGGLFWFMRRGDSYDGDNDRPWETLDADPMATGTIAAPGAMSATATLEAPAPIREDDAMVVVEADQETVQQPILDETIESPAVEFAVDEDKPAEAFGSLEDTFSSETAVSLDQSDPISEADFHMAYGLYDQAADLINGALEVEPTDSALLSKLCEIYFVWGNRDLFVDAAGRLKASVGDGPTPEWDKIVIMGQQIAADHDMFAGAELGGATKAVDLSFDDDGDAAGALDMDFGTGMDDDIVDLGGDSAVANQLGESDISDDETMVADADATVATSDEDLLDFDIGTSESLSVEGTLEQPVAAEFADEDELDEETAEINLDELDLDVAGLAETEIAPLDALDDTGIDEALDELIEATGTMAGVDLDEPSDTESTGVQEEFSADASGLVEGLDLSTLENSGLHLAADETGHAPVLSEEAAATDVGIDATLMEATGQTQILDDAAMNELAEDDATMLAPGFDDDNEPAAVSADTVLAPMDSDDEDFDFAKTEDLPADAFTAAAGLDPTGEAPAIAETDVDLDLDDLTAALEVSDINNVGDQIEKDRIESTVEQPRPDAARSEPDPTVSMKPDVGAGGDLQEARTMTEVGTKLDLARAYVDMGDPAGARSILDEVLDEGDQSQKQQAQQLLDSLAD